MDFLYAIFYNAHILFLFQYTNFGGNIKNEEGKFLHPFSPQRKIIINTRCCIISESKLQKIVHLIPQSLTWGLGGESVIEKYKMYRFFRLIFLRLCFFFRSQIFVLFFFSIVNTHNLLLSSPVIRIYPGHMQDLLFRRLYMRVSQSMLL